MSADNTKANALTQGVHHIGLTVHNVKLISDFFISVLGFKQVGEKPNYPATFISDGNIVLTLWQANLPEQSKAFDRKNNIGLHHLALRMKNNSALKMLHQKLLETDNVKIEFPPESLGEGPTQHMMCHIPGGIRIEFITNNN
jgi:catechol 2,3-dioxygenase-like lactoylglutathione lyase family enzyme